MATKYIPAGSYNEIEVGGSYRAVVVQELGEKEVEVVYLDDRGLPIAETAHWNGDGWVFDNKGPSGTYAEKSTRLAPFARYARQHFR